MSQIYVNRDGDLVDAQGKPLDWKSSSTTAPNPVGATSAREATIRDAGE